MNTEGKSVLVTRYFRAIRPPDELVVANDDTSFETAVSDCTFTTLIRYTYFDLQSIVSTKMNVARFVSLIPFVSDTLNFPGICDIWSTCDVSIFILDHSSSFRPFSKGNF